MAATNPEPGRRTRVLIVDDSAVIRKLLQNAIERDPGLEVAGEAPNGLAALTLIGKLCPDIVTLDIEMPEMDGITTLKEIKRRYPRTRVVMCSTLTERGAGITMEALAAGADDYVTKATGAAGAASFSAQIVPKLKQFFPVPLPAPARAPLVAVRPRRFAPRAVGIGVSTGGPNALAEIMPLFPKEFSLPILIVQHMPPMFTRLLAERLAALSRIRVVEAQTGMLVRPGTAYVAPGDYHMTVALRGAEPVIQLNQEPLENSCRPAVDVLFRSLGRVYGGDCIAAVLTGMGQDGLRGVEALRSLGAYVVAQDEASSVVWGMPGFVARAGFADAVCDLKAIPAEIMRRVPA